MPEVAVSAPGTVSWVDLSTTDPEGARSFYSKLFGWEAYITPEPESGGYTMFRIKGKDVAGVGPVQGGMPSHWMAYIATDDADATAKKVEQAGGKVIAPPFDVMKAGRMAVFQDPSGAYISVWQAGEHRGAQLTGEPNTFEWAELQTRDLGKARPFYTSVFGWGAKESPMGEGQPPYTEWKLGDRSVGGAMEMGDMMPAEVPPHWMIYFSAPDVDRCVAKASELGARTLAPPMDFPGGRFAILMDPQGAAFGVLKMKR